MLAYFYPRSPCGERPAMGNPTFEIAYFYPRSPCGERLFRVAVPEHVIVISIHALLAESDYPIYTLLAAPCAISIHALLAESDIIPICMSVTASISIHALLAESDPAVRRNKTAFSVFLSTLSLRRATPDVSIFNLGGQFLSTLSLRRATCNHTNMHNRIRDFYPRSPCGERRQCPGACINALNFYPRSPCGERPEVPEDQYTALSISIHALLAESDYLSARWPARQKHFYPRSPCGERRSAGTMATSTETFLSTLSLRRATTRQCRRLSFFPHFYPRSPCGERLQRQIEFERYSDHFYPRSPCGERRTSTDHHPTSIFISIHALLAESDRRP